MNSRKKIIDAATTVFSRTGFHQSSVDEIAKLAGVAKGTLYYNFSSKAEIFTAAVTEGMASIIDAVKKELESALPFSEHFKLLIRCNLLQYVKHRELAKIFFFEISSGLDQETLSAIDSVRTRYIDFIADTLRNGQEKGYLKPLNPRLAAVGLVGLLDGLSSHHLRDMDGDTQDQLVDTMYEILSTGLLAFPRAQY